MNAEFNLLPEAVCTSRARSKNDVLQETARALANSYGLDADIVLEGLEEREKLGSTGFGRGVAIPHARIDGVSRPVVVLLRLEAPVDFGAADGMPVDLVLGMVSPEKAGAAHLHALAAISRMVRDETIHRALIEAPDAEALYAMLANSSDRDAA